MALLSINIYMANANANYTDSGERGWKSIVYSTLKQLGLNEEEISLYTTSMELGPTSIASLARHLNLSRPSVYKFIGRLVALGLAKPPDRAAGQSKFQVEPATIVLDRIRDRRRECDTIDLKLTAALPELLAVYNQASRPAALRTYHGHSQLKHLHDSLLDEPGGDLRFFGKVDAFMRIFTKDEFEAWVARKVRAGIRNKVVIPFMDERLLAIDHEAALREIRVCKDARPFSTVFHLYADKVIFWWPETAMALRIDDANLFKMMEYIFTTHWETAEPLRDPGVGSRPKKHLSLTEWYAG